jgi:hypothetical protein
LTAVTSKDNFDKLLKKMEEKKKQTQTDLESVNQGKKTVRTIFKNEKDTSGLLNTIENVS